MNTKKAMAMITLGADDRPLKRDVDRAKKHLGELDKYASRLGKRAKGGGGKESKKGIFGMGGAALVGGVAGGLAGSALSGVSSTVGDAVSDVFNFERTLSRFGIASGKSGAALDALRASITAISRDTAVSRAEILAGAQTYVDLTGDVTGAEAAMNSFARIAQASGASVSDVATATAALKESMKLDPKDIERVFSGLIMQGKAGAVSLKDFAGELSSLAPRFAKFGSSGVEGIANMGAAFQVARKGFGSASEAATGLEALMGSFAQNAKKFKKANVQIFNVGKDGKKTFRSFNEIIDAIGNSKLAKDPALLTDAFGSKEAEQAYQMLAKNRKELEGIYQAGLDAGAVQRDLATYQESAAGKIEKAMNAAKLSLAEAFTPERIEKFANAAAKAAGWFADIVGYVDRLAKWIGEDTITGTKIATSTSETIDASNMTPQEKARAKTQKAVELAYGSDNLSLYERAAGGEKQLEAARQLAQEAGVQLPWQNADTFANYGQQGGGWDMAAIERAVARGIEIGMGKKPMSVDATVNVDKFDKQVSRHRKRSVPTR